MANPFGIGQSQVGGDDQLGAPSAGDRGIQRRSGLGYLVECDTGLRILEWMAAAGVTFGQAGIAWGSSSVHFSGGPGIYVAELSGKVRCVDALEEDGVALTRVATTALVGSTPGSWMFDGAAGILWLHTSDNASPLGKLLVATVVELYKFGPGAADFLRDGIPHTYHARLLAVPGVALEAPSDDLSGFAGATFGQLTLANQDGLYSGDAREDHRGLMAERLWAGRAVRVYRGDMDTRDRDTFVLWAVASMERPKVDGARCAVPLQSMGRLFDKPLCRTTFEIATYPDMDATLAGVAIPRVYGAMQQAQAFRIASGRWKVANHAVAAMSNPRTETNAAVSGFAADLPLGEFTCSNAFDAERRLFVDVTGRASTGLPGTMLSRIARDAPQVVTDDVDAAALARVDEDRPVAIGIQVLDGAVRDALARVAQSAFVDWTITRTNTLSARVRRRDHGNLVRNGGFETDAAGWAARNSAAIARVTAHAARGAACLQITKSAGDGLGHAYVRPRTPVRADRRYVVTALVALAPGSPGTTMCRLAVVDGALTVDLSEPFAIEPGVWQRVRFVSEGIVQPGVTWGLSTVRFGDPGMRFGMQEAEVRIYPQYGGGDAVVLLVDEVEWVEVLSITDSTAEVRGVALERLVLDRAQWRYGVNGRTGDAQYATAEAPTLVRLYPDAESRTVDADLVSAADAALVAGEVLDYHATQRVVVTLRILAWATTPLTEDSVIHLTHRRAPRLPSGSGLWRVVRFEEDQASAQGLPALTVDVVAHSDPAADRLPLL